MYGKYIVKTQGKVIQTQDHAYAVVAHNKNEAAEKAKEMFMEEYPVIENAEFYVKPLGVSIPLILGILLLLVAVLLSLVRWKNGHEMINIRPSFISVLCSAAIYSAYYVKLKGVSNMFKSVTGPIYGVLIILLISSFIQILFYTPALKFFGFALPIDARTILFIAIILSWAGYKMMSVLCIAILFIVSIGNLISIDGAMGNLYGSAYVLCAFFGLLAYMSCEPAFYQGVMDFRRSLLRSTSSFGNDFRYTAERVRNTSTNVINGIKSSRREEE